MALKLTITPSTQYIEDSINIKITGGTVPSNYRIEIWAYLNYPDITTNSINIKNFTSNLSTNFDYVPDITKDLRSLYWYTPNRTSCVIGFILYKPISGGFEPVSTVYKTLNIKPQPPTFDVTPTYEDINSDSLALTNDNQMIVDGVSIIRISNIAGTAYKYGTIKKFLINGNEVEKDLNSSTIIYTSNFVDKKLVITIVDSRNWSTEYELADISKLKYIWLFPKINNLKVEHNGINETTSLTASGVYSEGYQLGTTTFEANYSYKENVEGSTATSGASTLNITKNQTYDYSNFLAILEEYNNPTYQLDENNLQYYSKQIFENNINSLFLNAISYNDKYTQEYLQADYDSINEIYYCKSGGYNGSWKQFWRDTLELIYDKIIENGGNYEWSIEEPAIQGDLQSGFSIDKTFFVNLLVENTISGASENVQSQVLLPTAVPAIDVYKSNVAIHGLYDETLGGTQINGDLFLNGEGLFEQKVLWQGVSHMSGTQSITLSENITDQKHGIVLIWSGYNNGVQDYNFVCQFIPKMAVELFPGDGFSILLGGNTGLTSHKYIYVNNNRIVGNANNIGTNTLNGVTYNNELFALRRVIGI